MSVGEAAGPGPTPGQVADAAGAVAARRGGWRLPLRPLSMLVLVALSLVGVGSAEAAQRVVADQKDRLLRQRAAEAGALLGNLGSGIGGSLQSLATVVRVTGIDPAAFAAAAESLVVESGPFDGVAVVRDEQGRFEMLGARGTVMGAGPEPAEALRRTAVRALDSGGFVSSGVFTAGSERRVGFALLVPGVAPATVVYGESALRPPDPSRRVTASQPFGDLDAALYAGPRPDPAQLVLATTTALPIEGARAEQAVSIGADRWLLVVSARRPLIGWLAERQPWLLLAAGLLVAVLVAALVESLLRRRAYALALVDERTDDLERSLRDLDATQERLVAQERLAAIGELAAAVGHELRNPLGVLGNIVYLLRSRLGGGDPWAAEKLRTAERELAAATFIVADLLEFARPRPPVAAPHHLPGLVDEVLSVAPPPDSVRVETGWPAELAPVAVDRDQLRQVLLNLVTNAYEAMPAGGVVTLNAEPQPAAVRLTVADTGAGMDDETRRRLFEPFYTTKTKGIGLGLAVARRIVEAHGGALTAESRPGAGAAFTLTLPSSPQVGEPDR